MNILKHLDDYSKNISNLTKQDYFSKLKNDYPEDNEIERTNKIIQTYNITNGEQLTQLYLKTDVILLADVFEKFITTSYKTFEINPLYNVSLPGYTFQAGLKYTNIKLQTLQDKDMILLLENNIRGGISLLWEIDMFVPQMKKRYYILMQIIYMVGQCLNHYHMMILNLIIKLN